VFGGVNIMLVLQMGLPRTVCKGVPQCWYYHGGSEEFPCAEKVRTKHNGYKKMVSILSWLNSISVAHHRTLERNKSKIMEMYMLQDDLMRKKR
jgi:hypothetical protein